MTNYYNLFITVSCTLILITGASFGHAESHKPIVVMVEQKSTSLLYTINSQKPSKGLLLTLSQMRDAAPESSPNAILLVHEDVTITTITNVIGIMAKAGFVGPKTFYFGKDKDWMAELTFSKTVPFSMQGD